jgi:hypothetical protein
LSGVADGVHIKNGVHFEVEQTEHHNNQHDETDASQNVPREVASIP